MCLHTPCPSCVVFMFVPAPHKLTESVSGFLQLTAFCGSTVKSGKTAGELKINRSGYLCQISLSFMEEEEV